MGDERGGDCHQGSVFVDRKVAPLEIIEGRVFHGDVIVPVFQGTGEAIVPRTALEGPDGGEGLGGDHIVSIFRAWGRRFFEVNGAICDERFFVVSGTFCGEWHLL